MCKIIVHRSFREETSFKIKKRNINIKDKKNTFFIVGIFCLYKIIAHIESFFYL
ncbi:hypothetical protein HMPREF1871_00727 [Gemelliphila asaccharolytica]|uniref:Uncharacterized protein n=1 Tax=Gemelliphila asaccharolytica TaxID=502393 RepID=A0ABR5TLP8_9BACL|nr:hypothetical protein HMPREF1871_00727 [Gemella asaccharolytica]